jgi:hypothetical protein
VEAGCNFLKGRKNYPSIFYPPLLFSLAHSLNHPLWHHPSLRQCNKGNGKVCAVPGGCWEPWLSMHSHPQKLRSKAQPHSNAIVFRHTRWVGHVGRMDMWEAHNRFWRETCWENLCDELVKHVRGRTPPFFTLAILRWEFCFTPLPIFLLGMSLRYPLDRTLFPWE